VTFVSAARYRSVEGLSLAAHAQSEATARSAIHLAIFDLLAGLSDEAIRSQRFPANGDPVYCTLGTGSQIAISVGDEGGKVDLNTAGPDLIAALLRSFHDTGTAERLSKRILDLRMATAPPAGGSLLQTANEQRGGPIHTILELDQLIGSETKNWRALLPMVTVDSQSPGIDAEVASSKVLSALTGAGNAMDRKTAISHMPAEFSAPSPGRKFLVRADAMVEPNARTTLEAVVEFSADLDKGYRVREWRDGAVRYFDRKISAGSLPSC
jgi:general secretion pathway protein K